MVGSQRCLVSYFLQATSELQIQTFASSKRNGITPVCEELPRSDGSLTRISTCTLLCICEDACFSLVLNLDLVLEFLGKFSTRLRREVVAGLPTAQFLDLQSTYLNNATHSHV